MNELQLIHEAEDLVKERMSVYDSSHDWHHVNRVRKQGFVYQFLVLTISHASRRNP
jgi:hypothetical protein